MPRPWPRPCPVTTSTERAVSVVVGGVAASAPPEAKASTSASSSDALSMAFVTSRRRPRLLRESLRVLLVVVPTVLALLDGLPPLAVVAIPLDRRLEPAAVERVVRRPAEVAHLRRVDRVAPVVARAVGDHAHEVGARAGEVEDATHDIHVLALLAADVVDVPALALAQHELDR